MSDKIFKHKYVVGDTVWVNNYSEPMRIINQLTNDSDGLDYQAIELSKADDYTEADVWCLYEDEILQHYSTYACGTCFPKECTGHNNDPINPNHYKTTSGIQCIDVRRHFLCTMSDAIKYVWRAGLKDDLVQDLEKALWYLNEAIKNGDDIYPTPKDENLIQRKRKQLNPNDFNRYPHQKAILDMLLLTDVEQAKEYLEETIQRLKEQPK